MKTLDYWSREMLQADFLEKDLTIVFLPHFLYDFSRKMFLMTYCINLSNFVVWLLLLLRELVNMCIAISNCILGYNDWNFEINLIFLINPFFWGEIKCVFVIFKRTFRHQKLSQTWNWELNLEKLGGYLYCHFVHWKIIQIIRPLYTFNAFTERRSLLFLCGFAEIFKKI